MIEVGALEAKTHLSALLEEVSRDAEVLIRRRGQPVAKLVPVHEARCQEAQDLIAALRRHRAGMTLGGQGWKELRDVGRR